MIKSLITVFTDPDLSHLPHVCYYHANCTDGFAAATVVKMAMDEVGIYCDFVPVQYGEASPDVTDKFVCIVDFSYPRAELIKMNHQALGLVVLDHHKSAEEALEGLDYCHFDLTKSGAMLAWQFFGGTESVPELIRYVQDRDLWTWMLADSREFSAGLAVRPKEYKLWSDLIATDRTSEIISTGQSILEYQKVEIDRMVANPMEMVRIAGFKVPFINTTHLISELGNRLAPDYPFVAMYFTTPSSTIVSLRSTEDGVDVSYIATQFGGGGHRCAAGFSIPRGTLGEDIDKLLKSKEL